jgi:hypothetical protein
MNELADRDAGAQRITPASTIVVEQPRARRRSKCFVHAATSTP